MSRPTVLNLVCQSYVTFKKARDEYRVLKVNLNKMWHQGFESRRGW